MIAHRDTPPRTARRAISMVETVVATAIAGSVLVAAVAAAGITAGTANLADDRAYARVIAAELLEEMASKPYSADSEIVLLEYPLEPQALDLLNTPNLGNALTGWLNGGISSSPWDNQGTDTAQLQAGNLVTNITNTDVSETYRTSMTNFLEYDGLSESPPTTPTGDPLPGAEGLTRTVSIDFLDTKNPTITASTDTGLAIATVTILRGTEVLEQTALIRAKALEEIPIR
ncbi:MAG: hypothetical protein AAF108_07410 [Planctomycetota bacterium]